MKKYTIKDKSGAKKIIYAKDLSHALTLVDSKVKDAVSLIKGDWFTLRRENDVLYKVIDDQNKSINGFREAMIVEEYQITFTKDYKDYTIKKVGNKSFHPDRWSSSNIVRFNSAEEAMNWLKRQLQLTKHRFDSKVKDVERSKTFKFFINNRAVSEDEYTKSFVKEAAREHQSARTAQRVINEDKESAKVNGKNTFFCESGSKFSIVYDSVKDEANLPTTIQALVNDEEAAIKAYEVAIKNLEGKIDETQMQVLINIMKDERRHVENLYAILNGKVTEKNLEDSIKDATLEITVKNQSEYSEIDSIAKKLHLSFYETTGNKAILEGSRKDLEEYIDLVWGGDASIKRQIRG